MVSTTLVLFASPFESPYSLGNLWLGQRASVLQENLAMMKTCSAVVAVMGLMQLCTIAEGGSHRQRRGSIPGAVLEMRGFTPNKPPMRFGLQGDPDPPCLESDLPRGYFCPDGWTAQDDADGPVCVRLVPRLLNQQDARNSCLSMGGDIVSILSENRQQTVEGFLKSVTEEAEIWTGLVQSQSSTTMWGDYRYAFLWPGNVSALYNNTGSNSPWIYSRYRGYCMYLAAPNRLWMLTTSCYQQRMSVCDRVPVCKPGRTGVRCEKECHCHGDTSLCQGDHPCPHGCQAGWMGPRCCARKEPAAVAHYCINSAEKGRYLLLRVDPRNTAYDVIAPLDPNGQALAWCPGVSRKRAPDGTYTITVPLVEEEDENVDEEDDKGDEGDQKEDVNGTAWNTTSTSANATKPPSYKECNAWEKTKDPNAFKLRVKLQEKRGLRLPLDRHLLFTCQFDQAETLTRDFKNSVRGTADEKTGELHLAVETPSESKEHVSLYVVDAHTGKPVQQATLGSAVALRMRLTVAEGVTAQGVSPYGCRASTPGGEHTLELSDHSGCVLPFSPVSPLRGANGTVTSEPFQLFAFPGFQDVAITCSFDFCFGNDVTANGSNSADESEIELSSMAVCDDRCKWYHGRRRRDTQETPLNTSTTIIRVTE